MLKTKQNKKPKEALITCKTVGQLVFRLSMNLMQTPVQNPKGTEKAIRLLLLQSI
jgi:hypothetical protein